MNFPILDFFDEPGLIGKQKYMIEEKINMLKQNKINTNKDTIFISAWLFFSMIFAVGGGLFYFAGDSVKHKHVRTLIFKGVGFVLSALHIMFLQAFHAKVNGMLGVSKIALAQANSAYTISLIITIAALVVLAINYVLSIIFIQEDY